MAQLCPTPPDPIPATPIQTRIGYLYCEVLVFGLYMQMFYTVNNLVLQYIMCILCVCNYHQIGIAAANALNNTLESTQRADGMGRRHFRPEESRIFLTFPV